MFYTILWVIIWLMGGAPALAFGTPVFWALVVALLIDIFWYGFWPRRATLRM